jgi:O-antigen ligase
VDAALFAFQQFLEHFWTGRGLGAPEYYDLRAHNSFVHIGVEYGVAGVALYAIILLASLAKVVPYGFRAAPGQTLLTVYLIYYSVFDHYVHSYPTFSVAFGAIIAGTLLPERVDPPQRPAFGDPA